MKKLTLTITTVFALLFILYSLAFSVTTNNLVFNAVNEETKANMLGKVATLRPNFRLLEASDIRNRSDKWHHASEEVANTINPNERVVIYDKNQNFVFAYGNDKLTTVYPNRDDFSLASQMGSHTEVNKNEEGRITYSYVEKLYNGRGDIIGFIQIARFITDISHVQQQLTSFAVIASLTIVLILFIVLILYFRRISLPIHSINYQLDKLSVGDYKVNYEPVKIAEFDEIGENINTLSDNLQNQNLQIIMQDERLNLLVDSMILGMLLIESDHTISLANPAAYKILGINHSIIDKAFTTVLTSYRLIQMVDNAFKNKQNYNEEIYLYHPDEMVLDINAIFVDDHNNDEMDDQVIVLIYDITDIRRLEKVRTDFIANASHELKTPVTALQGFSETLLDGAIEDQETARYFVEIMNKESNRLGHLISDILDLAKIEQDQLTHHIESVDLEEAVDEVVQQVQMEADKKPIQIVKDNRNNQPIIFNSERGQINQIITNLVNNAINYTDPGGQVRISIEELVNNVQITVADNGIGIPEEDLPRIFERFYRVSKSRSSSSGGTGLGLSIVRNIVRSMGGHIDVSSQFGQGTEFRVLLPKNE
ncbi:two-component system histidine kinase PnpS [Aerococcus kribbianus]|uniref:histidine kinase n=1 Tax=Aerococcus kribbianus TaxID=2999064 RepID=A0A9X3JFD1_9LACT|nr:MULTISPECIES: HAMP domain-containing sensor histidine kinase [unclassified Aerococcus]MCZ0717498.1 ATP-binding protein [Aerococcus sp. YH-aer221]MCZ0725786.1 ATP-binding protein [Aerococcus sp. YH-aer222]